MSASKTRRYVDFRNGINAGIAFLLSFLEKMNLINGKQANTLIRDIDRHDPALKMLCDNYLNGKATRPYDAIRNFWEGD